MPRGRDDRRAEGGGLLRRPQQQAEQEATGASRDEQRRKSARPECRSSSEASGNGAIRELLNSLNLCHEFANFNPGKHLWKPVA